MIDKRKFKDLVEWLETKRYWIRRYRTWSKEYKPCHLCWKDFKKLAVIMEYWKKKFVCCPECLDVIWYPDQPYTMQIDDEVIIKELKNKMKKAISESKIWLSLEYIEDQYKVIAKACDELKKETKTVLENELSFNL